jgi:adenosylcobinamide-GDP ribazoletransferase
MGFLVAVSFLTILPVPVRGRIPDETLGRSTGWYPFVGALIGALMVPVWLAGRLFHNPLSTAVLITVFWIVLTRGLHMDGLADSADGLGGGPDRARKLAIMKDSRIGTFGVLAVIAVLLLKTVLLRELHSELWRALILAPVLARWVVLLAVALAPTAAVTGLAVTVKRHCRWPQVVVGSLTAAAAVWITRGAWGLSVAALAAAAGAGLSWLLTRALGGLTGDSYGALCEIVEAAALLGLVAVDRLA